MTTLIDYIKAENAKTNAWVAEDPENRWAGLIIEDISFWNNMGIHTVQDFEDHEMVNTYSDLHKEVHGFRPRREMSLEEIRESYDVLVQMLQDDDHITKQELDHNNEMMDYQEADWNMEETMNLPVDRFDAIAEEMGY